MIIDKVNGHPVPRYLIYDIIKFNVSSPWVITILKSISCNDCHPVDLLALRIRCIKGALRTNKHIFFLCATRSATRSLPASLPPLPFFLTSTCTGLEVRDFIPPQSSVSLVRDQRKTWELRLCGKRRREMGLKQDFLLQQAVKPGSAAFVLGWQLTSHCACEASWAWPLPRHVSGSPWSLTAAGTPCPSYIGCTLDRQSLFALSRLCNSADLKKLPSVIRRLVVMWVQVQWPSLVLALEKKRFIIEVVCPVTLMTRSVLRRQAAPTLWPIKINSPV